MVNEKTSPVSGIRKACALTVCEFCCDTDGNHDSDCLIQAERDDEGCRATTQKFADKCAPQFEGGCYACYLKKYGSCYEPEGEELVHTCEKEQALMHFRSSLHMDDLSGCGWVEQCPKERTWSFTHPDFPNTIVEWTPGREPVAV